MIDVMRCSLVARGMMHGCRRGLSLAVVLAPLSLGLPDQANAQWRAGETAHPAPALESRAGKLAGYAQMVDDAAERLHGAMVALARFGARDPQEGAVPPAQQALLDQTQTAWMVIRNTPEDFSGRDAFIAAERQFAESMIRMQRAETSPMEAVAEVEKILSVMERLEHAAAAAAMEASAGG